ncbi:DUF6220 domain-containing protein [Cohnella sp. REN36]|uniref:DUF6220 domain-containing protein n=1 Tax=Cohnella sp. REN36 TaxID=2887347 RepID=UPI001D14513F|nr:DUF6220 domain-containing protein [Cohnella sp. REN36]MCC3372061.1 DUF6220 domain-containing protein [Cohnella sp. REN36]
MNVAHRASVFFKWLAWIFAVGILVQVLFAGMALFYDTKHWTDHSSFATYISLVPVLMLVTAFAARLPTKLRAQTGMLIGMIVLIVWSAMFSSEIGWFAALHPVIALLLFFRTMAIIRLTAEWMKSER